MAVIINSLVDQTVTTVTKMTTTDLGMSHYATQAVQFQQVIIH